MERKRKIGEDRLIHTTYLPNTLLRHFLIFSTSHFIFLHLGRKSYPTTELGMTMEVRCATVLLCFKLIILKKCNHALTFTHAPHTLHTPHTTTTNLNISLHVSLSQSLTLSPVFTSSHCPTCFFVSMCL